MPCLEPYVHAREVALIIQSYGACGWLCGCTNSGTHQFRWRCRDDGFVTCCREHFHIYANLVPSLGFGGSTRFRSLSLPVVCWTCLNEIRHFPFSVPVGGANFRGAFCLPSCVKAFILQDDSGSRLQWDESFILLMHNVYGYVDRVAPLNRNSLEAFGGTLKYVDYVAGGLVALRRSSLSGKSNGKIHVKA